MKIKIKYCGGCNAAYDRVKFARDLSDQIKRAASVDLQFIYNDEAVDKGIVICGCPACCADRSEIKNGARQWHIIGPDLLDYVYIPQAKIIDNLIEKIAGERRIINELD